MTDQTPPPDEPIELTASFDVGSTNRQVALDAAARLNAAWIRTGAGNGQSWPQHMAQVVEDADAFVDWLDAGPEGSELFRRLAGPESSSL